MFQPSCFLLPPKNPTAFCCKTDIFKNRGFQENIYSFLVLPIPKAGTSIRAGGVLSVIVSHRWLCGSRATEGAAGTRFLPPVLRRAEHQTLIRDISDAKGAACQTQEAATCRSRSRLGREAAGFSSGDCLGNGSSGCCGKPSAELSSCHT